MGNIKSQETHAFATLQLHHKASFAIVIFKVTHNKPGLTIRIADKLMVLPSGMVQKSGINLKKSSSNHSPEIQFCAVCD